jgi:hypothetical protein
LGLVQAENTDDKDHYLSKENVKLIWDDRIEKLEKMYGSLSIEHIDTFWHKGFYLRFHHDCC